MGNKPARRPHHGAPTPGATGDVPVVGPREPCPCGSGRRYKACHGREAARTTDSLVLRPFAGLPSEADWVALREIVPAATAPLTLTGTAMREHLPEGADVPTITLATVLPMSLPALRRQDGSILLGLQVPGSSGDVSRDLADTLVRALSAPVGTPLQPAGLPAPGPRLQDLLDLDAPLEVTVHDTYDFWIEDREAISAEAAASLEQAGTGMVPTVKLSGVDAAYWCQMRERNHLRWGMTHDEEPLLDALARLHAAGDDLLGDGTRYVGSFRAHGIVVPVWDLPSATGAEDLEEPAAAFHTRLAEALTDASPLTDVQRRARNGLLSRQLTLR